MKVLIATAKPFAPAAVQGIREIVEDAGYELALLEKYQENSELLEAVADANALIIRSDKITREVMDAAPNLRIVVRAGAGYDNVDLQAAREKGVCVMNTPGQNSNAVAELAFGMMVLKARNKYNGKAGTELKGKKLGIHAFGNVGRLVALIGKGFSMDIYAFDPFLNADQIKAEGVTPVESAEALYQKCDYISLHIPSNEKTKKSIGYDLLKMLPSNGTLVNTARKEVIDEEGLMKLMDERDDIYYLSDIAPDTRDLFEDKYPDNVFFTPKKMGAQTSEANINAGLASANQIIGFLKNGDETFKVN
jgi:D-3-phosphoglycerate dehydrogenase